MSLTGQIPNPYLSGTAGPEARLPARVCRVLEAELGRELALLRTRARGVDPEVAYALMALRQAALGFVPPEETERAESEGTAAPSEWLSTTQAAESLGLGRRAITYAVARRLIPATRVGRAWRIRRSDLDDYRARRAA